ncbi:MAG: nucleotidyltransferase domain-containing protein [Chloroflexi bacterium]|nr:nucleotidyltransferase domain-containing protein [Chloroflexota bacterium]
MDATVAPPTILDEIVSRLANGLRAEQIYLFGSRASGQAGPGSDYDLMVIVPRSNLPRYKREAVSYDLLWGLTTPVDVIVLTRAEFRRLAQVKTSLAATVKSKGILMYGRPQT